jgi:hypothetical protein
MRRLRWRLADHEKIRQKCDKRPARQRPCGLHPQANPRAYAQNGAYCEKLTVLARHGQSPSTLGTLAHLSTRKNAHRTTVRSAKGSCPQGHPRGWSVQESMSIAPSYSSGSNARVTVLRRAFRRHIRPDDRGRGVAAQPSTELGRLPPCAASDEHGRKQIVRARLYPATSLPCSAWHYQMV